MVLDSDGDSAGVARLSRTIRSLRFLRLLRLGRVVRLGLEDEADGDSMRNLFDVGYAGILKFEMTVRYRR